MSILIYSSIYNKACFVIVIDSCIGTGCICVHYFYTGCEGIGTTRIQQCYLPYCITFSVRSSYKSIVCIIHSSGKVCSICSLRVSYNSCYIILTSYSTFIWSYSSCTTASIKVHPSCWESLSFKRALSIKSIYHIDYIIPFCSSEGFSCGCGREACICNSYN